MSDEGSPGKEKIPDRIVLGRKKLCEEILDKIREISGEDVYACMQCGKCSAGCPMTDEMDISPAQVFKYLMMGEFEALLESKTAWICSSCFTCALRCPKGVDLSRVLEAVRSIMLRKRKDKVVVEKLSSTDLSKAPPIALISILRKHSG